MFRLGRLQSPRKVQAGPCLNPSSSRKPSQSASRALTRHTQPRGHTSNPLKIIRVVPLTRHSLAGRHPTRMAVLSEWFATRLGSQQKDPARVAHGESKGRNSLDSDGRVSTYAND